MNEEQAEGVRKGEHLALRVYTQRLTVMKVATKMLVTGS